MYVGWIYLIVGIISVAYAFYIWRKDNFKLDFLIVSINKDRQKGTYLYFWLSLFFRKGKCCFSL